jgi:hypothetical protein
VRDSQLREEGEHLRAVAAEGRVVHSEGQRQRDEHVARHARGGVDRRVGGGGMDAAGHQVHEVAGALEPAQHQHRVHQPGKQPIGACPFPRGRAARAQ